MDCYWKAHSFLIALGTFYTVTSFDNPKENHFVCGNDEPLQDSFL
jgi:hypothetical protein